MRADLHIHSHYSDGLLSPEEIAKAAAANGMQVIAVTDHDAVSACGETAEFCKKLGVKFVDGIEISAYSGDIKVHTLGYNLDKNRTCFKAFAEELYNGSFRRAEEIVFKLNKIGVRLSLEEILKAQSVKNIPVHTMHIARAAAKKGYASSPFVFYNRYLAYGKPAFSNAARPAPERAVEIIKACGGFSSLAHPARIDLSADGLDKLIKRMASCGLDGIEAVYSAHTPIKTAYFKETASKLHIYVTGGSDTHFFGGNRKIGTPEFHIGKALAEKLGVWKD